MGKTWANLKDKTLSYENLQTSFSYRCIIAKQNRIPCQISRSPPLSIVFSYGLLFLVFSQIIFEFFFRCGNLNDQFIFFNLRIWWDSKIYCPFCHCLKGKPFSWNTVSQTSNWIHQGVYPRFCCSGKETRDNILRNTALRNSVDN